SSGADRLTVTVSPASANRLTLTTTAGAPQTAGGTFSVTVTALDAYGNIATGYTGGMAFSSDDPQATPGAGLPANFTFTGADAGTHTFNGVALKSAGSRTVTATDTVLGTITGTSAAVSVAPAATVRLAVSSSAASPQTAGTAFGLTVTAKDAYGNTNPAYTGTVHAGSDDGQALLPADYTFTGADNGSHTFAGGATLKSAGARTISVTDTATGSINGSTPVTVAAAGADHFAVSTTASAPQTAGGGFSTTI